jgi:hypothetical protein
VWQVLEVCSEEEQTLLLTRMRNHLSTLKKFTYGKHIVARVEKMVAQTTKQVATQRGHTLIGAFHSPGLYSPSIDILQGASCP